jgi:hypothetical protein
VITLNSFIREIFTNINIRCPPNTLTESCPSACLLHKASLKKMKVPPSVGARTLLVRVNLSEV